MKSTNSANWILVTGTSTGIGRAATFTLAENGYRVLAGVRKQEDIESLLAEAGTRRVVGSVEPIILDVTDAGQIAKQWKSCRGQNRRPGGRLPRSFARGRAMGRADRDNAALRDFGGGPQFDSAFLRPGLLLPNSGLLPQLPRLALNALSATSIGGIMQVR